MNPRRPPVLLVFALALAAAAPAVARALPAQAAPSPRATEWEVSAAPAYDALCLVGVLGGDPFYVRYFEETYRRFDARFTAAERDAFRAVKRILKDETAGIVSARLGLVFSAAEAGGLGAAPARARGSIAWLLRVARDPVRARAALARTPYWSEEGWAAYARARPHLVRALQALGRAGFEDFWERQARPRIERRIAELAPFLRAHDVVPAVEARLGKPLPSRRITVHVLAFARPHGIRIVGTRFLADVTFASDVMVRNAIHEMMHPPYDASRPELAQAVAALGADPLVRARVEHHDRSFGYNTVEGYVEEDVVEAMEAVIADQLGVGRADQAGYWRTHDDGMHVLAAALYVELRRAEAAAGGPVVVPAFLVDAVRRGDLTGEQLARTVEAFLGPGALAGAAAPAGR
ncbi:hypothetical protein ACOQFB_09750 [Anaeromyxobacter sp. Red801]|uniref:hypothetical protein n=1 Tax=Anaeromyxobacter sp. Red801 TaxID=3411632 RepID=UPI003B9FB283